MTQNVLPGLVCLLSGMSTMTAAAITLVDNGRPATPTMPALRATTRQLAAEQGMSRSWGAGVSATSNPDEHPLDCATSVDTN